MFLKSLTLKGFKSFAEPTTLQFEPGITVVVGPNGSGKSNVVDAVAWVLGAQGARMLRSGKMEDVIFAGSGKKPALGRAAVSLVIDNTEGRLPIDLSEITISRTLFRSGDSEYALNGATCRLLDIQELLSDSGIGRQQHVIVTQGQLDTVLSAQPEDRRLIIEEAAGVLKFRRRRERAERRLHATDANVERLTDLLREVRRQIRPLERQADAARRHAGLADELRSVRLFVAGRELESLSARLATCQASSGDLRSAEGARRATLARLDSDIAVAEAALTRERDEDLAPALGRLDSLIERARGLHAVLGERQRGAEAALQSALDEDVAASLQAEHDDVSRQLAAVSTEEAELGPLREQVSAAERDLESRQVDFEGTWADETAAERRTAEAVAQVSALRLGIERDRRELSRLETQSAMLQSRGEQMVEDERALDEALGARLAAAGELTAGGEVARREKVAAEQEAERFEEVVFKATRDQHSWQARSAALAEAYEQTRAEQLAGLGGVVGTLGDLVDVDPGWEAAFESAAGEALRAVVAEGPDAARAVMARLEELESTGSVLAEAPAGPGAGEEADPGDVSAQVRRLAEAGVADPVGRHVRSSRPGLSALLDELLLGVVRVAGDWRDALDLHLEHPGLVVVTSGGQRFSRTGWRTGRSGAHTLDEARRMAEEAAGVAERAAGELNRARSRLVSARSEDVRAVRDLDRNEAERARVSEKLDSTRADLVDVAAEQRRLAALVDELGRRIGEDDKNLIEWQEALPGLEAESSSAAERAAAARADERVLRERAGEVASMRRDFDVRAAGLGERRSVLARRLGEIERRLSGFDEQETVSRVAWAKVVAGSTERLGHTVAERLAELETHKSALRTMIGHQLETSRERGQSLGAWRWERAETERELTAERERLQRLEIEEAEIRLRIETATERLQRELGAGIEEALGAPAPELPGGTSPAQRASELERELRLMGPINPLALEELDQLFERSQLLEGQLEDVRSARRDLAKVIRAVDAEIVDVFAAAYADVADNFADLCSTLFQGGAGQLRLSDPTDLLETGIEIEAQPPGRHVRRLALLSGGERSLVALAFLFAVFRSRPSPFYLLDEVEAALDDVNLHRFLDLLHDFRDEAQLIVVSHQKRTMEAADCLFGVTMQPGGSSRVISERASLHA